MAITNIRLCVPNHQGSVMLKLKYVGLALVFLFFMLGGVGHFTNAEFFINIVPPYLPFPEALVAISGVFEILGAIGILIPRFRQWTGWALFALVICVTPANIHMWMNPDQFPDVPEAFLTIRLFLQIFLLWLIWWSTRLPPQNPKQS